MPRPRQETRASVDTSALITTLDRFCAKNRISRAELARWAETSDANISRIFAGVQPSPAILVKLADAMGMTVWSLMVQAGYPITSPDAPTDALERVMRILEARPDLLEYMIMLSKQPLDLQENLIAFSEAMAARHNGHHVSPRLSPE